jgi:hypothetical protein
VQTYEECVMIITSGYLEVEAQGCGDELITALTCATPVFEECPDADPGQVTAFCNDEVNTYNNCLGE